MTEPDATDGGGAARPEQRGPSGTVTRSEVVARGGSRSPGAWVVAVLVLVLMRVVLLVPVGGVISFAFAAG